jgi:hypothetical protein
VLALGSVLLAGRVRWQRERLQKWERVAAYLVATGGLIPGLVLLALFVAGKVRG